MNEILEVGLKAWKSPEFCADIIVYELGSCEEEGQVQGFCVTHRTVNPAAVTLKAPQ